MSERAHNRWEWLADAALIGALALAAARCLVRFQIEPLGPGATGMEVGPEGLIVFNSLSIVPLIGASAYRLSQRRSCFGAVAVLMLVIPFIGMRSIEHLGYDTALIGSWWAALALGVTVMYSTDSPRRRIMLVGVLVGLLFTLSLQAINQYVFEHARTVEHYETNREALLEQMGIEPGSVGQTKYETRLYQREATGSFGLSNVFGSVLGVLLLTTLGAGVAVWRSSSSAVVKAVLAIVCVIGLVSLGMTHSKGAVVALMLVGVSTVIAWWITRNRSGVGLWRAMAFGLVALVLGVLAVRFAVGPPEDHTGERSLLFRTYYIEGSMRMIAEAPISGIGDFGEAYLRFKNPLAPEDVSDPHNVFAMWIASLGIVGLLGGVMLLAWLWRGMSAVASDERQDDEQPVPRHWHAACAIIVSLLIFAAPFGVQLRALLPQAQSAGEQAALALLAGIMPAIGVVVMVLLIIRLTTLRLDDRWMRTGLFAAAVMVMVHGQIEMNLTNPMAAPLMCVLLGAAGCGTRPQGLSKRWPKAMGVSLVLLTCLASAAVIEINRFDTAPEEWSPRQVDERSLIESGHTAVGRADYDTLVMLLDDVNDLRPTYHEQVRSQKLHRFIFTAQQFHHWLKTHPHPDTQSQSVLKQLEQSILSGCEDLAERTPYSIDNHLLMADAAWDMGMTDRAAAWYRRAIEISDNYYLDPDSQMVDEDRRRAERRIAAAENDNNP